MSVKLLLVGILVLVVIGLYRRYTEDRAADEEGTRDRRSVDALAKPPVTPERPQPELAASATVLPAESGR